MPLYTVISTRLVTEAHTIWAYHTEGARGDVELAPSSERDERRKPVVLDHGRRNVESVTLVREDTH